MKERQAKRRRSPLESLSSPLAVAVLLIGALVSLAPQTAAQQGGRFAVASENELASREALAQMKAGGNAVDAIVTSALMGGVASGTSSGIGGGGFALLWSAKDRKPYLIDFREVAPAGIDTAGFERRPFPHERRAQLTGVPGEVAGLFQLHQKYGKRSWQDVVAPAARWARKGFPVGKHLGAMLAASGKILKQDPGLAAVYYPQGKPAAVGSLAKNEKLAATLELIAAGGPKAFYEGKIAKDLVAAARSAGGTLSEAELKNYKPIERAPLTVKWEGKTVYTMPPPSAGGLMVAETLGLFSSAELKRYGYGSGAYTHMISEAMRSAIADRMRYIGDPDHEKVDMAKLLAPARLAKRKQSFALDRTHGIPRFGLEEHGTHHMVAADAAGNVVSLTTTVNRLFGAKLMAADSGVVMNDELDDFTEQADVMPFGMKQSPNRPRPSARPVSSMTPTIVVENGAAVFALGGSGGPTIATNVTQLLLGRLIFGRSPAQLVKDSRVYIPTSRAYVLLEDGAPADLKADLEWRGEIVGKMPFKSSAVQLVAIENGRKSAASDPRKFGSALVY